MCISTSVCAYRCYVIMFCTPNDRISEWRHNERNGVWNHQSHDCLLNRQIRRRSKYKTKLRVTGLCEGNSPVTSKFPAQRARKAKNVSIWWRHHGLLCISVSFHIKLNIQTVLGIDAKINGTIISSGHILSTPSHLLDQCWPIANWTRRNIFWWNNYENATIFIQINALDSVVRGDFVFGSCCEHLTSCNFLASGQFR